MSSPAQSTENPEATARATNFHWDLSLPLMVVLAFGALTNRACSDLVRTRWGGSSLHHGHQPRGTGQGGEGQPAA